MKTVKSFTATLLFVLQFIKKILFFVATWAKENFACKIKNCWEILSTFFIPFLFLKTQTDKVKFAGFTNLYCKYKK